MATEDQHEATESPPTGGLSDILPKPPSLVERVVDVGDRVHIPLLASALTFDGILAMVPLAVLVAAGLALLVDSATTFGVSDTSRMLEALLPAHLHVEGPADPFAMVEGLLETVRSYRSRITWVAVPAFIWFGSRLFAAVRNCLSQIFQVRAPRRHPRMVLDFLLSFGFGKLRDIGMMSVLLLLAFFNAVLSAGVALLSAEQVYLAPPFTFLVSTLGRILAEVVTIASAMLMFGALYRYASPKRLAWGGVLVAASTATFGFEVAKRLFGWYLASWAQGGVYSVDANIGALLLFLLWIWWVALVFLIGAAAASVWEQGRTTTA